MIGGETMEKETLDSGMQIVELRWEHFMLGLFERQL